MSRKAFITPALAAAALAFFSVSAHADVIAIDSVVDGWLNPVGGLNVSINNTANPGTDIVSWGTGEDQSAYKWNSTNTSFNVTTGVPFSLGKFTHVNEPIGVGSGISKVDLSMTLGNFDAPVTIGGTFTFNHNETSNTGGGCCNDLVTISNAFFNTPFQDNGGTGYFFTLLGFTTDGGVNIINSFSTQENHDNKADLYAVVTTTPIPEPVPEPTSLLLLGTGIVGGALRARRRRS